MVVVVVGVMAAVQEEGVAVCTRPLPPKEEDTAVEEEVQEAEEEEEEVISVHAEEEEVAEEQIEISSIPATIIPLHHLTVVTSWIAIGPHYLGEIGGLIRVIHDHRYLLPFLEAGRGRLPRREGIIGI